MMKKFLFMLPLILTVLTGCSQYRLKEGQYFSTEQGREDQICVYDDLIFVKIKTPDDSPDSVQYWQWGGKYEVNELGEISFDMDKLTKKKWNFYFSFVLTQGNILVKNQGDAKTQTLKFAPIRKRQKNNTADQETPPAF